MADGDSDAPEVVGQMALAQDLDQLGYQARQQLAEALEAVAPGSKGLLLQKMSDAVCQVLAPELSVVYPSTELLLPHLAPIAALKLLGSEQFAKQFAELHATLADYLRSVSGSFIDAHLNANGHVHPYAWGYRADLALRAMVLYQAEGRAFPSANPGSLADLMRRFGRRIGSAMYRKAHHALKLAIDHQLMVSATELEACAAAVQVMLRNLGLPVPSRAMLRNLGLPESSRASFKSCLTIVPSEPSLEPSVEKLRKLGLPVSSRGGFNSCLVADPSLEPSEKMLRIVKQEFVYELGYLRLHAC